MASNFSPTASQVASPSVETRLHVSPQPDLKKPVLHESKKLVVKKSAVAKKPKSRVKFVIKSVTKPLKFSTYRTKDKSLVRGTQKVKRAGKAGKAIVIYRVRYVNGKAVSRSEVRRNIVVVPQPKVVVDGLAQPAAAPRDSGEVRTMADVNDMPLGTVDQIQAYAQSYIAIKYDWQWSQYQCLVTLWNRESHWNYRAYNSGSGAAGIPQALPGSKMATFGADWRTNPATQVKWGASYIDGRYGNPCGALGHSNSYGWY